MALFEAKDRCGNCNAAIKDSGILTNPRVARAELDFVREWTVQDVADACAACFHNLAVQANAALLKRVSEAKSRL